MLPFLVPVDSHTAIRASVSAPEPVPEAGAVWGKSSAYQIEDPAAGQGGGPGSGLDDGGGGGAGDKSGHLTIVWPKEDMFTSKVTDWTPVWREYDLVELTSPVDDSVTLEVAVTRALLFPLYSETLKYTSGGSYVDDPAGQPYSMRVVHSYLLLSFPRLGVGKLLQAGLTEGEFPNYWDEMFPPGHLGF